MSLRDRLRHLKAALSIRPVSLTEPRTLLVPGESDAGELVTEASAMSLPAVWGCVNLLAGTVATLPLMLFQRVGADGARQPVSGNPLARVLHDSPNYDQTAVDFWEFASASLELWGNFYAEVARNDQGRVVGLSPVSPVRMAVRRRDDGAIEYRWTDDRGRERIRTDAAVFHVRGPGGNPLGGMSTLQFGRQSFGLARAIDRSAATTFRNGVRPSGVMTFADWLTDEQRAKARGALTDQFVGAANAGKPFVLEGGTTWTQLSINPDDAQMLESRRFSVEEVCRFFGVPPHMIGHTEKNSSWGTGIEQQTLAFQKFTLRRRLKRIEQAINKQLLTNAERARGVYAEFNLEGLLRGDSASRAGYYQSALQNGWMTINEVRQLENRPPVSGGDVPRMQAQNVPIDQVPQAAPQIEGSGRDDEN